MDWQTQYKQKTVTLEEAASMIKSGDAIGAGSISGFPLELVNAITAREDLEGVMFYSGLLMCIPEFFMEDPPGRFSYASIFLGPVERLFLENGAVIPSSLHFSQAAAGSEVVGTDVSLLEVSPPDANGYMSIGPGSSMMGKSIFAKAPKVIVQVNPYTPVLQGTDMLIHVSEVDAIAHVDRPLFEAPPFEPDDDEKKIAGFIAERIPNGATLQLGIGKLANAIGEKLDGKKDLGIHTELLTPSMIDLFKKGVITGREKTVHPEKMIVAFSVGTAEDYAFMDNNPAVEFHPAAYVNNPFLIAQNKNFISVNNALAVDLTGQVASESLGYQQFSGTGGQVDFVRGAKLSEGGKSYIALKSTASTPEGKVSRISVAFNPGTVVTTPRSDVQCIATEFGIAEMEYKTIPERVNAMISIAHPDFRESLAKEAVDGGLVHPSMLNGV